MARVVGASNVTRYSSRTPSSLRIWRKRSPKLSLEIPPSKAAGTPRRDRPTATLKGEPPATASSIRRLPMPFGAVNTSNKASPQIRYIGNDYMLLFESSLLLARLYGQYAAPAGLIRFCSGSALASGLLVNPDLHALVLQASAALVGGYRKLVAHPENFPDQNAAASQFATHGHGAQLGQQRGSGRVDS